MIKGMIRNPSRTIRVHRPGTVAATLLASVILASTPAAGYPLINDHELNLMGSVPRDLETDSPNPDEIVISPAMAGEATTPPGGWLQVSSADKLSDVFERLGYRLDDVRRDGHVPRVFLASLPHDLPHISIPKERKVVFIKTTLPLVLYANELIQLDRQRILRLRDIILFGGVLDESQERWLHEMVERYDLEDLDDGGMSLSLLAALLHRVDIVPPSLALAQAAEESGWGTSRFAREGNALFGQRVFFNKPGIVPKQRDDGETHRVRAFEHLIDAVRAYIFNLNTHDAYGGLRAMRAAMRAAGQDPDSERLADTLTKYSERREAYVDSIRTIIRVNKLKLLDSARLGGTTVVAADDPNI